jgi:general L-amino acid transport system substrate-binding protein
MNSRKPSLVYGSLVAFAAYLVMGVSAQAEGAKTLDEVRKRGHLRCGVSEGLLGFSTWSVGSGWRGLDVDYCRAVATAIFGDEGKVKYTALSATDRFSALATKQIDVLSRNTTWTMSRDILDNLDFVGVWYFDVQGLMSRASTGIKRASDLSEKTICALKGTTQERSLVRFLEKNRIKANLLLSEHRSNATNNYKAGRCAAYASDISALAAERHSLRDPSAHEFLPFILSKEPLGPVVRSADPAWREFLQWVLFLVINAEEAEWTAAQARVANLPAPIQVPQRVTKRLKLTPDWERQVIAKIGNYGEIFSRNLGDGSPLKLPRGLNASWKNGGLLFAPPIR